jgi:hypothetical protein
VDGGGMKKGAMVGSSNDDLGYARDLRVHARPAATILWALGPTM